MPLLEIQDLRVDFGTRRVVDGVSLSIDEGQTLCLVGESGCGKSVTALSIARLLPTPPARHAGGRILLQGRDVLAMSASELRSIRGGVVSYIFQEPGASLNPVMRIGAQVLESLRLHVPARANEAEVVRLLRLVGIPAPERRSRDYPHQLSGGMQQRVMIAMALATEPRLLVADEPTTALDVTIQAQILRLLADLQRDLGIAMVLITHDLGVVARIAHRVAVMYAGEGVEEGTAAQVFGAPRHPYTQGLLDCIPVPGRTAPGALLGNIPGTVPSLIGDMQGCGFRARCAHASAPCANTIELRQSDQGHRWRCVLTEGSSS